MDRRGLLWIVAVVSLSLAALVSGQGKSTIKENTNQLIACENSGVKDITCPSGEVIDTVSAFWGRGNNVETCPHVTATGEEVCEQENAYDIFREMCDGRTQCIFDTNDKIWGDEICPSVHKYLYLEYSCVDCVNLYADDYQCEQWALNGQCGSNKAWMTENCKKTCERCGDWTPANVNYHSNDTECEYWAATGECIYSPVYMMMNCRKSCVDARRPTECTQNRHDDYINMWDCGRWGRDGQCQKNANYMMWDCTATCFGCGADDIIKCEDKLDAATCEAILNDGNCTTDPGYAVPNCLKTCLGCTEDPVCANIDADDDCQAWASPLNVNGSECDNNPVYMYNNCWKTCMHCEQGPEEKTKCDVNHWDAMRDADNCEARTKDGQCSANSDAMMYNCTKSCFECDEQSPSMQCIDKAGEAQCQQWAAAGQCDVNPGFMIPLCMKSCLACTEDPVCEDVAGLRACNNWMLAGECRENPVWMHKNCMASCMGCQTDIPCQNLQSDIDCEYWMRFGGCRDNNVFMMNRCGAACSRCNPEINGIPDCEDSFSDCDYWYDNGDCPKNPTWLQHYCRKSCTHCDQLAVGGVSMFGANVSSSQHWRSSVNSFTRGKAIVLPNTIGQAGRLRNFNVRVVSDNSVMLQIWRLNATTKHDTSKSFDPIYEQTFEGQGSASRPLTTQVQVDECVEVKEGDRIGFTTSDTPAPFDYRRDLTISDMTQKFAFRSYKTNNPNSDGTFLRLTYLFEFAISVDVIVGDLC